VIILVYVDLPIVVPVAGCAAQWAGSADTTALDPLALDHL
jgi:hypothetical protein